MTGGPVAAAGYFRGGMPYNRLGRGPRPLVVFQGLLFENRPQSRFTTWAYRFLEEDYTVYLVLRKPGLPVGCSLRDMADDYAAMIREEFGGPLDVIGVSTGGSIVQHFAADHPELVRRLVLHSSAYRLSDEARRLQLEVGRLAREARWREACALMMAWVVPRRGMVRLAAKPITWLGALALSRSAPEDPTDLVVTIAAEDRHDFKERLRLIAAPTLVIAGAEDPFYSPVLFRETATGIPDARLILYEGMGHPASGRGFAREVLAFLREGR